MPAPSRSFRLSSDTLAVLLALAAAVLVKVGLLKGVAW
jgi:hypothetical protein